MDGQQKGHRAQQPMQSRAKSGTYSIINLRKGALLKRYSWGGLGRCLPPRTVTRGSTLPAGAEEPLFGRRLEVLKCRLERSLKSDRLWIQNTPSVGNLGIMRQYLSTHPMTRTLVITVAHLEKLLHCSFKLITTTDT